MFDLRRIGTALAEPVFEEAAALCTSTSTRVVRPQAVDDFVLISFKNEAQGDALIAVCQAIYKINPRTAFGPGVLAKPFPEQLFARFASGLASRTQKPDDCIVLVVLGVVQCSMTEICLEIRVGARLK